MRRLGVAAVILAALAGVPAVAASADPPVPGMPDPTDLELEDVVAQLPGIIEGLAENRTDMARCPELAGGTVGTPEHAAMPGREDDAGNPLVEGDPSSAPRSLPDQVLFRSETQSFNRRYQVALAEGSIYYKSNTAVTGIEEPWAELPTPDCFAGRAAGVSLDDDELLVIDEDRWVYTMDGALRSPEWFTWSMRWGRPFWTGAGRTVPRHFQDWEWSVISQLEDGTWRDDAGNDHAVGDGKVSHIWLLNRGGRGLTYLDPWLPPDESYEACGPHRGRFRAVSLSVSGSTLFVVGRHGDLFTRLYDFDIAGADPLFFDYSYEDQRGVADPVIQLPSPDWVEQPKVPGHVTDRISIHKVGRKSLHRELRVEGRHRGRTGYWHKDITAARWHFATTGRPLLGSRLDNPRRDTSARGLAPAEDRRYTGLVGDARVTVEDFSSVCTPSRLRVELATGERLHLVLHSVDNIRQRTRARGLDDEPRMVRGTIEVPPSVRGSQDPDVQEFLASLGEGRFIDAPLDATVSSLVFRDQGWTLAAPR